MNNGFTTLDIWKMVKHLPLLLNDITTIYGADVAERVNLMLHLDLTQLQHPEASRDIRFVCDYTEFRECNDDYYVEDGERYGGRNRDMTVMPRLLYFGTGGQLPSLQEGLEVLSTGLLAFGRLWGVMEVRRIERSYPPVRLVDAKHFHNVVCTHFQRVTAGLSL